MPMRSGLFLPVFDELADPGGGRLTPGVGLGSEQSGRAPAVQSPRRLAGTQAASNGQNRSWHERGEQPSQRPARADP